MPSSVKPAGSVASSRAWEAVTPSLSEWLLHAVSAMGFGRMTPVQASVIPLFKGTKDVVVEAVTGSGKTLAFLIPVVERLLAQDEATKKHHVAAIVLSPTRELAAQIYNVLESLLAFHGPSAALLQQEQDPEVSEDSDAEQKEEAEAFAASTPKIVSQLLVGGSVSPAQDLQAFVDRSPNVLIATPGRLLELLSSSRVHCTQSSFEVLVLDEADRLLDLGFKDTLQKILARLPKQRRTGLFSASVSEAVDEIIRVGLRNPVKIAVKVKARHGDAEQRTPTSLAMQYVAAPASHKIPYLVQLLHTLQPTPSKTIVYLSTCAAVDYFQHILPTLLQTSTSSLKPTFSLFPLHGKHVPSVRQKNFRRFQEAVEPSILLTTDVAARGLDIPQVDLVVQLDPPSDPKVFLHRCGRAGRAGRAGQSLVFLTPGAEEGYVPFLDVRGTPVTELSTPRVEIDDALAQRATQQMRELVRKDRALHDIAQRAFVSWVRSYAAHQATSIFHPSHLDWADLGAAWGLLRLPRMPERRTWEGDESLGVSDIDWDAYRYLDPQKERERRKQQAERAQMLTGNSTDSVAEGNSPGASKRPTPTAARAWSSTQDRKQERDEKRERKRSKRAHERAARMTPAEREQLETNRRAIEAYTQHRQQMEGSSRDLEDEFHGFDD